MKQLVVNLFSGPGAGKSTMAAGLFYKLKLAGYNVELALEYAKDLTWEERFNTLCNQPYIFGKQYHRLKRLEGKVDAIITDSPLLLSCFYSAKTYPVSFKTSVIEINDQFDNWNFFINRVKPYQPKGRNQTEDQAEEIDQEIKTLLNSALESYLSLDGNEAGTSELIGLVSRRLFNEPRRYDDDDMS